MSGRNFPLDISAFCQLKTINLTNYKWLFGMVINLKMTAEGDCYSNLSFPLGRKFDGDALRGLTFNLQLDDSVTTNRKRNVFTLYGHYNRMFGCNFLYIKIFASLSQFHSDKELESITPQFRLLSAF